MNSIFIAIKLLFTKPWGFIDAVVLRMVKYVPDELFIKIRFRSIMGYWPNLKNPKTLNEKLQWLKFNDIHPEYTTMVDKVAAKEYVASKIGGKYIIPTYGVWNSVDDIEWEKLPDQFVIKSTNDSGGVVVCRDKTKLDIAAAKAKLRHFGGKDYSKISKEYPYKKVPHRFIAEQYLEDKPGECLTDYKIFCFNGEPRFLYLSQGMDDHATARMSFLNIDWNFAPYKRLDYKPLESLPEKPQNYEEMLEIAKKLSEGIPHVRVDLYSLKGKIYFGELTFFTCSGMIPFDPAEWDLKLGEYLEINN